MPTEVKNTRKIYTHNKTGKFYALLQHKVRMQDDAGKWHDAVLYASTDIPDEGADASPLFVRSKADFENSFEEATFRVKPDTAEKAGK